MIFFIFFLFDFIITIYYRVRLCKWMSWWTLSEDVYCLRVCIKCQGLNQIFILWIRHQFLENVVSWPGLNVFFLSLTVSVSHPAVEAAVEMITGKQLEMNSEGNGPLENHTMANKSLKRPNADSDEEEDKGSVAPPIHDIYRARQQKRIRWAGPIHFSANITPAFNEQFNLHPPHASHLTEGVPTPSSTAGFTVNPAHFDWCDQWKTHRSVRVSVLTCVFTAGSLCDELIAGSPFRHASLNVFFLKTVLFLKLGGLYCIKFLFWFAS